MEEFQELNAIERSKLSMDELCEYYRALRKYVIESGEEIKGVNFHKAVHPTVNFLIKGRRIVKGQKLDVYNNGIKTTKGLKLDKTAGKKKSPIIFAITHTGKYDIEITNEAIKSPYYLLSDDEEYMHRTIDGYVTNLNGVIYVDSDYPEDQLVAKKTAVQLLKQGANIMWYPEGIWNLSENQLILPCKYGIIDAALEAEATIIPIAIDQKDKNFYVNIGDPISYDEWNVDDRKNQPQMIEAINTLRDKMATLKYDIWLKFPVESRKDIPDDYYEKFVEEKINEWPYFTREVIAKRVYKPKNIVTEDEAFNHLENIKIDKNNAFLLRKQYRR